MKVRDVRDDYYHATQTLSELTRNFSFAGIAVVWILTGEDSTQLTGTQITPLAFFILILMFDFLQSLYKSFSLEQVLDNHIGDEETEVEYSDARNAPTKFFFRAKCLLLPIAYAFLMAAVITKIRGA